MVRGRGKAYLPSRSEFCRTDKTYSLRSLSEDNTTCGNVPDTGNCILPSIPPISTNLLFNLEVLAVCFVSGRGIIDS